MAVPEGSSVIPAEATPSQASFDENAADAKLAAFVNSELQQQDGTQEKQVAPAEEKPSAAVEEKKSDEDDKKEKPEVPESEKKDVENTHAVAVSSMPPNESIDGNAQSVWDEVHALQNAKFCKKCRVPMDISRLVQKSKGEPKSSLICRSCNASTTMLSRHLGKWPVQDFTLLPQDSQIAFWRKCSDVIQQNGRLDYQHLRANLSMSLVQREVETTDVRWTEDFLPLSVWVAKGFDADLVKKGEKETNPVLGETYALPLKSRCKEFASIRIEEMLVKFEGEARRKQTGGRALQNAKQLDLQNAQNSAAPDEDDSLKQLEWMDAQSPGKKRKADEMEESQENKPADGGEKKLSQAQLNKKNNGIQKLAKKGHAQMVPLRDAVEKQLADKDMLPCKVAQDLVNCEKMLKDLMEECQIGFKTVEQGIELQDLSFSAKDLTEGVKKVKQIVAGASKLSTMIQKTLGTNELPNRIAVDLMGCG